MNTIFLINDSLLFDPDEHSLRPREGFAGSKVIIHTPASECLLLMLRHNHQVLTQRFLFEQVWEKHGAVVTTNALYQSITSLRKGLKSAGLAENIIKTVPKMGFKSIATVREGTISDFLIPVESAEPAPLTDEILPPKRHEPAAQKTRIIEVFHSRWAYFIAGLAFILSCSVLYMQRIGGDSFYSDYHYIGQVKGCSLYSSWSGEEKSISTFLLLDKRQPVICKTGTVAYLTLNYSQQGVSVLLCNSRIEYSNTQCQSYILRKDRYEN